MLPHAALAATVTCTWAGPDHGSWDNPASWSGCAGTYPHNNGTNNFNANLSPGSPWAVYLNVDATLGNGSSGTPLTVVPNATLNLRDAAGAGHSLTLVYSGSGLNNTGTINVAAVTGASELVLSSASSQNFVLSGSLVLGNGGSVQSANDVSHPLSLTNQGTISGYGALGNSSFMTIVNNAVINANSAGHTLVIELGKTNSTTPFTNNGIMQAGVSAGPAATLRLLNGNFGNSGSILANAGGIVSIDAAVVNGGGFYVSSGGQLQLSDGAINTGGTSAATLTVNSGGTVRALAGATGADAIGATGVTTTIDNAGAITAASGATLTVTNATLNNSGGVISAEGGGIVAIDASTVNGGTLSGAGAIHTSGATALNGVTNNTTVSVTGAGTTTFAGGANAGVLEATTGADRILRVDGGVPVTNSGTIQSNGGAVTVTHTIFNADGTINNVGGTVTLSNAAINGGALGGTGVIGASNSRFEGVTNNTTLSVNGGGTTTFAGGANAGVLEATTSVGRILVVDGSTAAVTNTGVIQSNGGAVTVTGNIANAGGVIQNVGAGTLTLSNAAISGGTIKVDPGSALQTWNHDSLTDVTVVQNGAFHVSGSTLTFLNSSSTAFTQGASGQTTIGATLTSPSTDLTITGGAVTVQGVLLVAGANYTTDAAMHVSGGGRVSVGSYTQTGGSLVVDGTVTTTGAGAFLQNAGSVVVGSTGTLTAGGAYIQNGDTTIDSGGALTADSYTLNGGHLTVGGTLSANGSITIAGGVLNGTGALNGAVVVGAEGELAGTVTITGSLADDGVLSIGDSPGIMNVIGDYAQTGVWEVDLDELAPGTGYDQLNVTGNVTLGGVLDFNLGFTPPDHAVFTFLTYSGTLNGQWAAIHFSGPQNWRLITTGNSVSIELDSVPEPASLALFGLAVPVLCLLHRRRSQGRCKHCP